MAVAEHSFGYLLRRYRLAALLTQEQLAERAHLSYRTISDLERGAKHTPRRDTVLLLADALELSPSERATLIVASHPVEQESETMLEAAPQRPLPIGGFLGALPAGPLVARDEELRTVLSAVEAVAGGRGRLLLLAGEPGIGKTRVAQEVSLHLHERGFLVAGGRCYEPQEVVPFYPFLEALETLYVAAPASTRTVVPQRWPYLGRLLPNETLPTPPRSFEGKEEQERLFWSVTGFLQNLADHHPVALLLDDLHWADASSLLLLQHLARQTRAYRVLLLATYRDVEVVRHQSLEAALRDLLREQLAEGVAIRRLGQDGTAALIATSFGQDEISADFAELVYHHTEGNPFFIHEILRTLVERGDVYRQDGHWEGREVEELSVPETVRSAIRERLSRLREETQELLHEAGVLGQTFCFDDLQAMGDRREEEVERALVEAEIAGLVRATGKDEYSFNHALTQQALYGELAPRRKRRLHRAAGAALKRMPERTREQRVAELARHFLLGDDSEQALPYVLEAGNQAEEVFAHREAERQYRTALELARQLEDRVREAEALEKLGGALVSAARFDEALEVLERALEIYRADGDREGEARATMDVAGALEGKGRTAEAVIRLEQLLKTFAGARPSPGHARLYVSLAIHLFYIGRYDDMLTAADRAVELAGTMADERVLAEARHFQGTALQSLGRISDAREVLEEAAELMERLGAVRELHSVLGNLGEIYLIVGEFEQTRHLRERKLPLSEQVGEDLDIAFACADLSEIQFYLGDWPAARGYGQRAADILKGFGPSWHAAYPPLLLGIVDLAEGRWEAGYAHMAACLAVAEQHGDLQALRVAHQWLAEHDLVQGRPEEARTCLEPLLDRPGLEEQQVTRLLAPLASAYLELAEVDRAEETVMTGLKRASRQSHRLALVDLARVQGKLRSRQGRWQEAEQAFREAIQLARRMPYPYAEARALYESGIMHVRRGQTRQAQEPLKEALAIFQRLGARKDVERAVEALGRC